MKLKMPKKKNPRNKKLKYKTKKKFKKWYLIEVFINYLQSFIVLYFEKRIHGH